MKQWLEIISIWVVVAASTVVASFFAPIELREGAFAAILAGSIAFVSLVQLFRAEPHGFVRRLVYVGGGSYLILAVATFYLWLRG